MEDRRCDEGTMVLIVGIVSAVVLVIGPAAVILGNRAMQHLPKASQQYNYARTGWIIGWIATGYLAILLLLIAAWCGLMLLLVLLGG